MRAKITANLDPKKLEAAVSKAWRRDGERPLQVLADASKELTPVDTGALRDSCEVVVTDDGGSVRYTADYAVYVHEIPAQHETGQDKFLETAAHDPHVQSAMLEEASETLKLK